jgi:hypothetical protein
MKNSDTQEWEQIRAKGRRRFVVRYGLLYWGLPFGLVTTLGPVAYGFFRHSAAPSVWSLTGSFIVLCLGFGYGMGETEWRRRERAYHANLCR